MKTLALIFLVAGTLTLQACSNGGPVPIPGDSSSPSSSTSSNGEDKPDPTSSAASSVSSAGPVPVDPIGDPVRGASLFHTDEALNCSGCHTSNDDGTFGGAPFDVNQFRFPTRDFAGVTYADEPAGLSGYIHDRMPLEPELCVDDCADDIAAYLWSLRDDYVPPTSSSSSVSSVASSADSVSSTPASSAASSIVAPPTSSADSSDPVTSAPASSASSTPSSVPNEGASIAQARDYVVQVNNLGHSISLKGNPLGNLGVMLFGDASTAYNQFAAQIESSAVMSDELDNVIEALNRGGLAFGSRFVQSVAGLAVIPAPADISLDGYNVVSGGSTLNPTRTYQFTFNGNVSVCDGGAESCNVRLVMDVELDFPNSQPTGANETDTGTTTLQLGQMNFVVRQLSASNEYVSVEVAAGEQVISADRLTAVAQMDDNDNILSALVASQGFSNDVQLTVRDLQANGASLEVALSGSIVDLEASLDMLSDDMSVDVVTLAGAAFEGNATFANADGDSLSAEFAATPSMVGSGPFTYVFGDELVRDGENASNYLGLGLTVDYTAIIGGDTVLQGAIVGSRSSDTTLALENYTHRLGSLVYVTAIEFQFENGAILALEGVDPISGVTVSVSTSGGTTTGVVSSGSDELGTIARNDAGDLIITYTDGTTQPLVWGEGAVGPAPDPNATTPPPPVSSASSAASSISSAPVSSSSATSSVSSVPSSTSSVASSSSSAPGSEPSIGDAAAGADLFSELCTACHTNTDSDVTYGFPDSPWFIDPNNFTYSATPSLQSLAAYIGASMPPVGGQLSPGDCVGSCAEDTAAYLWSLRSGQQPPVSSSSASTSSASSSVSSVPSEGASVAQARDYVVQVNNLGHSISLEGNILGNLGVMLFGDSSTAYNQFVTQIDSSAVMSDELDNVIEALNRGGLAFGSRFVQSVAGVAVIPAPDDISLDGYNVVSGGSTLNPTRTYQFTFDGNVSVCDEGVDSCNVRLVMDVELDFPNSQPTGANETDTGTTTLQLGQMNFVVHQLTASNEYVSIEVSAGERVISADRLTAIAQMDDNDNILSALVAAQGFNSDLQLAVRDLQANGSSLEMALAGGIADLEVSLDMLSDDMSVDVVTLAGAAFEGNATFANAQDDSFSAEFTAAPGIVGSGPFTYVLGDELVRDGEDASNYLGLDLTIDYTAVVGGDTVLQGGIIGSRASDTSLALENFTHRLGSLVYVTAIEYQFEDGAILALEGVDPISGVTVSVSTSGGTTTGTVSSGSEQLGTIARNSDGVLIITYADDSTQPLVWGAGEVGPAPDPDGAVAPPPVSSSSSSVSSASSVSSVSSAPPVSSSSSISSVASSSSSSATSSVGNGEPATVEQAVDFGTEVSKLITSINFDANALLNLGGVLDGQDSVAYGQFAEEVQSAALLSSELDYVLAGLGQVGLAFGSRFVESVAGSAVIPAPDGISTAGYSVVTGGSALNPERYYRFSYSGQVSGCEGDAASCDIQVDMEIELAFPNSQPTGAVEPHSSGGENVTLRMGQMQLVVSELRASNAYVAVEVSPGANAIFADSVAVLALMDADQNPVNVELATEGLGSDLELAVLDARDSGVSMQGTLIGSLAVMELVVDMLSDDLTLTVDSLTGASFGGNAGLSNSQGDNFYGEFSLGAGVVGSGPFTFVIGETLERFDENTTNYLGVDGSLDYSATIGGATLLQGSLTGGRSSDAIIALDNYTVEYAGSNYIISAELDVDTFEMLSFVAYDTVSGVTISADSSSGSLSGVVVDGAGNELGTVDMDSEGYIIITYADGTIQQL